MQQDPQQAAAGLIGLGIAVWLFIAIFTLAIFAFFIFLYWRIFTKAGMSGALSLLMLIPGLGPIIIPCILAFSEWKVVPVAQSAFPPVPYPPPPSYPSTPVA